MLILEDLFEMPSDMPWKYPKLNRQYSLLVDTITEGNTPVLSKEDFRPSLISTLQEYKTFKRELAKTAGLNFNNLRINQDTFVTNLFLRTAGFKIYKKTKVGYDELEKTLLTYPKYVRVFSFLYGVDCSEEPVELKGGLRIRSANSFETSFVELLPEFISPYYLRTPTTILETTEEFFENEISIDKCQERAIKIVEENKEHEIDLDAQIEVEVKRNLLLAGASKIEDTISVLRLMSPGILGAKLVHLSDSLEYLEKSSDPMDQYLARTEFQPGFESFSSLLRFGDKFDKSASSFRHEDLIGLPAKHMEITKDTSKQLTQLWQSYQRIEGNERITRAVRRYNNSIRAVHPEDALVDLIISLEVLFQAMGYKVTFLASFLYGLGLERRRHAVEVLENAYRMRNATVHGGGIDEKKFPIIIQLFPLVGSIISFAVQIQLSGSKLSQFIQEAYLDSEKLTKLEDALQKWRKLAS